MGNRINIKVIDDMGGVIYLYSHWKGPDILKDLYDALKRGHLRWEDPPYLTRIIFSDMIRGDERETTGYGISTYECGGNYSSVVVDIPAQCVRIDQVDHRFKDFIAMDRDRLPLLDVKE